jgi:hypothetical protein
MQLQNFIVMISSGPLALPDSRRRRSEEGVESGEEVERNEEGSA